MSLLIRPYEIRDREQFGHVRSMTYRDAQPISIDEKLVRDDCSAQVAELDGRVVGSATVIDMFATRGDGSFRCAGVAGVAVLPEFRARGVGSTLMAGMLPMYKEEGFEYASLYPFRSSFYRKFGYEHAGLKFRITCPPDALPKVRQEIPVQQLSSGDYGALRPCYDAFAKRYSGMNNRKDDQWFRQLGGDTPFVAYVAGDPPEAYVTLRLTSQFWEKQEVREIVWTTPRGYDSILSLLGGIGLNKTELQWPEPGDSPYLMRHWDHGANVELGMTAMYRILDVRRVLSRLHSEKGGSFSIAVRDEQLSDNEGPWRVELGQKEARVSKTVEADMEIHISALSQAVLGEPSLLEIAAQGRCKVCCAKALDVAANAMPRKRTYCLDLF